MLRAATGDDVPLLREMLYEAAFSSGTGPGLEEALVDPTLSATSTAGGGSTTWGSSPSTTPRAMPLGAACTAASRRPPGYGFLDEATPEVAIACRAPVRGQGLGHQLMEALLDRAAAEGVAQPSLSVALANPVARLVYFDCGYRDVPRPETGHATMVAPADPAARPAPVAVRPRTATDLDDPQLAGGSWGEVVVSLGTVHRTAELDGLVAEVDGRPAGLLTWRLDDADGVEVVTLDGGRPAPAWAPRCCGPLAGWPPTPAVPGSGSSPPTTTCGPCASTSSAAWTSWRCTAARSTRPVR